MRVAWIAVFGCLTACASPPPPCPCMAGGGQKGQPVQQPAACPSATTAASAPEPEPVPQTCGLLALLEARLVAGGKGDAHPRLMAVRARLAQCANKQPTAEECAPVLVEAQKLATTYGPNHPARLMNDAERALCAAPQTPPKKPPPPGGKKVQPNDDEPPLSDEYKLPACGAGTSACGYGPHSACCGKGETCCAGGAAGNYYCLKGKGPCPPLP